tara:strand:+ start:660 stop:887 length:228 start_codon:yes stop_codon:yes gene_type:complete
MMNTATTPAVKQNWFETLNASLDSEGLVDSFPLGANISYGETYRYSFDDGSKHGRQVSISRGSDGRYERPVHYPR